jgi:hypothetical protein
MIVTEEHVGHGVCTTPYDSVTCSGNAGSKGPGKGSAGDGPTCRKQQALVAALEAKTESERRLLRTRTRLSRVEKPKGRCGPTCLASIRPERGCDVPREDMRRDRPIRTALG